MNHNLFKHDGRLVTSNDILGTLQRMKVDQCDVLYIHTGMQFGLPNLQLGRTGLLEALADVLYALGVPTLILPTYTFSFCNGEEFDVKKTPSSMGTLNEYLRTKHRWMRSKDPLMSNILHGSDVTLINNIGKFSVGMDSTFDLLSKPGSKVKFLFLGPRLHDCFTYMHYLEAIKKVPYRYDYEFIGSITDGEKRYQDKFSLYIRDTNVLAGGGAKIYENILIERGQATLEFVGGGAMTVVGLEQARDTYLELLDLSPNFYVEEIFNTPVRPSMFAKRKMVAL
jgi:aminoglycoside 3-N-acetyltransferase